MFKFECELVDRFHQLLQNSQNPFSQLDLAFEFDYQAGRVDIVGTNAAGELHAFEAKLSRWRDGMHQAYRNSSFTHYSYVVLPEPTALKTLRWRFEFERRGVGLCSVNTTNMTILIPATKRTPLQPWLTNNAVEYIKYEIQSPLSGVGRWHPVLQCTSPWLANWLTLNS